MTKYRAIVSIEFDDEDLENLALQIGANGPIPPDLAIDGELDNLSFGSTWTEQLFRDGEPTIARLSGGIQVEINPHE